MGDQENLVKIDSSFKFEGGRQEYETEHAWAKVRVLEDERKKDYYIDVLIGSKESKEVHIHMGVNGDGSFRFVEPRNHLNSLRREAVDSIRGRIDDQTFMLKPNEGKHEFKFTAIADAKTRIIKVLFDEAKLTSPKKA